MSDEKLYEDMTRREKGVYLARNIAKLMKSARSPQCLIQVQRKIKPKRGESYWKIHHCVYDCVGKWTPIDMDEFYREMGIVEREQAVYVSLRKAGYDAVVAGGAVVVLGKIRKNKSERKE